MNSYHQRDTTFTKIFVGGLPYHTTDETLQKFFEPYGNIEEAVVITDRQTGKSRGYGFVTMSDRLGAERACKDPNPIIDGRKANVNLAYLGAKPRIPVGELIAAFPFGLKTGPTAPASYLSPEIMGFPQLVYPSTYLSALPTGGPITLSHQPHILQAPLTQAQLIDYSAALGASPYSPSPLSGFESALQGAKVTAYPYMTGPAGVAGGYLTASSSSPSGAVATFAPLHHLTAAAAAGAPQPSQTFIGQFVSAKQLHAHQDRLQ